MTNKQKRIAFRIGGHLALALGCLSAYRTHSAWGWLALFMGPLAVLLALMEVMNKADERAAADIAEDRRNVALIRAAAAGLKPKPPGMEIIREGCDPVVRP